MWKIIFLTILAGWGRENEWDGLQGIGMVKSKVIEVEGESEFTQYFITSLIDVNEFAYAVRKYWSIENQFHWCLDVIFREDAARARKEMSPLNMNVLRKTALSLRNQAKHGRLSKKKMMFKVSLHPDVLLSVLLAGKSKCCCPGRIPKGKNSPAGNIAAYRGFCCKAELGIDKKAIFFYNISGR